MSFRHWMQRLAFSFLIIGAVLWWQAYRIWSGYLVGTPTRLTAYVVIGALLVGAGFAGISLRHRGEDQ